MLEPSVNVGSKGKSNSNSSDVDLFPSESNVSITKFIFFSTNLSSVKSILDECESLKVSETT